MEFFKMFGKNMMENAHLEKISILLQFGSEILGLLCTSDSIKIVLIWSLFQTFGTETKLEGFVWNHQRITTLISPPQIAIRC